MTYFKDANGKEWGLLLNLGTARRVKDKLGADLLNPNDRDKDGMPLTTRLLYDDLLLASVCEVIVDASEGEFQNFDGASLKAMDEAFWKEYRRFFAERGKDWAVKAIEADLTAREKNAQEAIKLLNGETSSNSQDAPDAQTSNA